ncbi:MAG: hypothetical protein ABUL46_02665, partial [Chitinophaga rupis]
MQEPSNTIYRLFILFLSVTMCCTSCSKNGGGSPSTGTDTLPIVPPTNPIGTAKPHDGTCCLVSNTDDATKLIEVYDPADTPWTTTKWAWKPTTALGYTVADLSLWAGGTDVKLRNSALFGGTQVIIAASYGMVTIASYPGGEK